MKTLAIISAREGSKGFPGKNIVQLGGKPLIAWTILAARKAKTVNRIIVTTDSTQIADIALRYGAEAPFIRPKELALDDTPGILPILHAINWLSANENYNPHCVIHLQPTSPLRTAEDIDNAGNIFKEKGADSLVSVTPVEQHPYWMKRIDKEGVLTDFIKMKKAILRRQELPLVYIINGAIYIAKCEELLRYKTWYLARTFSYVMPKERSIDIDTLEDLSIAEYLIRKNLQKRKRGLK